MVPSVQNINMPIADAKEYRDKFLKCPFCLTALDPPKRMLTPFGNDVDAGKCPNCGAAYVYDVLCKSLGDMFMDAVAYAFDWDYDAYNEEAKTYEDVMVRSHSSGKFLLGEGDKRDKSPKFIFVRRTDKD